MWLSPFLTSCRSYLSTVVGFWRACCPRFSALLERLTLPAVGILLALLFFGQLGAIIGPLIENLSDAILQLGTIF